jgi:hypothetical protein
MPKTITRRASSRLKALPPDKRTQELEDQADQLDKMHALDVMAQTEGARVLVDSLVSDCITAINALANRYKTMPEMEMRAYCAELSVNLALMLSITRSKMNRKALEEALAEALKT